MDIVGISIQQFWRIMAATKSMRNRRKKRYSVHVFYRHLKDKVLVIPVHGASKKGDLGFHQVLQLILSKLRINRFVVHKLNILGFENHKHQNITF